MVKNENAIGLYESPFTEVVASSAFRERAVLRALRGEYTVCLAILGGCFAAGGYSKRKARRSLCKNICAAFYRKKRYAESREDIGLLVASARFAAPARFSPNGPLKAQKRGMAVREEDKRTKKGKRGKLPRDERGTSGYTRRPCNDSYRCRPTG